MCVILKNYYSRKNTLCVVLKKYYWDRRRRSGAGGTSRLCHSAAMHECAKSIVPGPTGTMCPFYSLTNATNGNVVVGGENEDFAHACTPAAYKHVCAIDNFMG